MLNIISLGAGVQSTTMALMAALGEITPMPDCAIFADTQGEPKAVYDHLKWLSSPNILPFPIKIVTRGSLEQQVRDSVAGKVPNYVPWFSGGGDGGMLWRICTDKFKLTPLHKEMRQIAGIKPGARSNGISVTVWIGISTDESIRMKPSQNKWSQHRWPLIEAKMNRNDCLRWIERHGYPKPPKSACSFCPYRSDAGWRDLRDNHPDDWKIAIELDKEIRNGVKGSVKPLFMHNSKKPLDEVDLSTAEDHGQLNLFNNECEGMCGV